MKARVRKGGPVIGASRKKKRKEKSKWKQVWERLVSIRVLIIVAVIVLVVAAAIISWVTQYFLTRSGINDLSDSIRYLVRVSVQYQVSSVLDAAKSVSAIDNGTFTYSLPGVSTNMKTAYWKHIYRLIQSTDVIGSLSYGDIFGNIIGARRTTSYELLANLSLTDFLYYFADGRDPMKRLFNYEVDPVTINPGSFLYTLPNFSLFDRLWWHAGLSSPDGSYQWSPIYLSVSDILTVTIAQPYYQNNTNNNTLTGVLGVHLFLPRLKQSLMNITHGGDMVVIVDANGNVVIDSCPAAFPGQLTTCPGVMSDTSRLRSLRDSGGLFFQIDKKIQSRYGSYGAIVSGDTITMGGYWISFEHVVDRNLDWIAVIMIHIDDYLSKVNQANTFTLIGACIFCFFAAIAAFLASVVVTRPISRTISQMDQIASMDFSKKNFISKRSSLYEINSMEKAISRLRTALCSFEKFVPNNVVKQILAQDVEAHLGVSPCMATIFFCDIEDFTTIAEVLNPTSLVDLLLDFLQEMSNIILEECQGTIDKFIGDAIMAFWNAPTAVDNHAERACMAALHCHHKIQQDLQPKWVAQLPEGFQLNARFGVHTGEVLIGNIGSLERINYTAIGDHVNIAARLEALCKFYRVRIIISGTTYNSVKHSFLCRPLDRVVVKGKSHPLILYELVAERSEALPEQIQMCTLVETAADLVFANPDPEQGVASYVALQHAYPDDVSITRVRERVQRLLGKEQWPGLEIFDHK